MNEEKKELSKPEGKIRWSVSTAEIHQQVYHNSRSIQAWQKTCFRSRFKHRTHQPRAAVLLISVIQSLQFSQKLIQSTKQYKNLQCKVVVLKIRPESSGWWCPSTVGYTWFDWVPSLDLLQFSMQRRLWSQLFPWRCRRRCWSGVRADEVSECRPSLGGGDAGSVRSGR